MIGLRSIKIIGAILSLFSFSVQASFSNADYLISRKSLPDHLFSLANDELVRTLAAMAHRKVLGIDVSDDTNIHAYLYGLDTQGYVLDPVLTQDSATPIALRAQRLLIASRLSNDEALLQRCDISVSPFVCNSLKQVDVYKSAFYNFVESYKID